MGLTIVAGERERVGLWMIAKLEGLTSLPGGFECLGVARDGVLIGGVIFTDYRPCRNGGDITVWAVGDGAWLSRRVIREILSYPFVRLNCHRLTAATARSNKPSRKLLKKLGFVEEGKLRRGYDVRQDLIVHGLLRNEQRWVKL